MRRAIALLLLALFAAREARAATYTVLDVGPAGNTLAVANGISASGRVAGQYYNGSEYHAFRYTTAGGMQDLDLMGTLSVAYGISPSGRVAGYRSVTGTGFESLGTLGGSSSVGHAVTDAGQVAGYSNTVGGASPQPHAFRYTDGPGMEDLGTLGGTQSIGRGIDAAGRAVGGSLTANDTAYHAFLYDAMGMHNLNDFIAADSGWVLYEADGINDSGQTVGYGSFNGQTRPFRLDPVVPTPAVPEPGTLGLALLAGGALAARRARPRPRGSGPG